MKRLLAVIDMQVDFVNGALGTAEAEAIVPRVKQVLEQARQEGATVVFTLDTHEKDYPSTQEGRRLPVAHCLRGTDGWRLVPELQDAAEGTRLFEKPTFGSTTLADYARAEGFEEITLCGLCTDICVISNALLLKAFLPEAVIRVQADACAGVSPESHETALAAMSVCQIEILRG